jgi:hypothetical protein
MFSFSASDKVERTFLIGAGVGTAVLIGALIYGLLYIGS